jgi:hypothetical protein
LARAKSSKKDDPKFRHKVMTDAGSALIRLEDRIGLNIAGRNAIVQRLFEMPAARAVIDAPPVEAEAVQEASTADDEESPLGYLHRHSSWRPR